ncbi:hypothetical protein SAMN02745216_00626 [Desulfatibacillum alkenivorans DSM 16219]|uniref:Uncharacterized protein n=1 Tax=Desulfatibacillum alkenivorans DSM 16219 TaxID=1121393 RepID=A0A1M6ED58_9BACT|nr:hypothetical protein SAMN02745216_00626 [Desulfatibacillum alkenivorans DSM 16219]
MTEEGTGRDSLEAIDGGEIVAGEPFEESAVPISGAEEPFYLEAGEVTDLDVHQFTFNKVAHEAKTARILAIIIVIIFGVSFFVHYLAMFVALLLDCDQKVASLGDLFNSWLPVISGFVGACVTYYFTKDK